MLPPISCIFMKNLSENRALETNRRRHCKDFLKSSVNSKKFLHRDRVNPALPLMLTSAAATPVQNGQNALSGTLLDQEKTCNIKVGQNFTLFLSVVKSKR